ncbi:MAG TPA: hypothetical protein VMV49_12620 [Candidatus Deferrimicrobium sp.]|nr:hypothetical protein [Candidatus Deferrimicrobium sp.]
MRKIAKRSDWETLEKPPEKYANLEIKRKFTEEEMIKIKRGVIPQSNDDKWFIFYEDGILYFYRCWSGFCIYWMKFEKQGNDYHVIEARVNRDKQQYVQTNDEIDLKVLNVLIDSLLHD